MNPRRSRARRAFTIVEMLVVIGIIALLVGVLLPAVSNARNQAKVAQSQANLRQIGTAHVSYSSEWNDRQFTLTPDDLSAYALPDSEWERSGCHACIIGPAGPTAAVTAWECCHRTAEAGRGDPGWLPAVQLGWGPSWVDGSPGPSKMHVILRNHGSEGLKALVPMFFSDHGNALHYRARFGWFRLPNARQFTQYLSGRFFDPVFYAPKDTIAMDMLEDVADVPGEFAPREIFETEYGWSEFDFLYSSYSLSPAALVAPTVMGREDPDHPDDSGWTDPWSLPGGFRAPSASQARFPGLKTRVLEHHWLQKARADCNPKVVEQVLRPYRGCQPYFFNQSLESAPVTLFYDGHVELVGVTDAQRADGRSQGQADHGLWSRDTPLGDDGYWIDRGYDNAETSFHVLTTEGILGRDVLAD